MVHTVESVDSMPDLDMFYSNGCLPIASLTQLWLASLIDTVVVVLLASLWPHCHSNVCMVVYHSYDSKLTRDLWKDQPFDTFHVAKQLLTDHHSELWMYS